MTDLTDAALLERLFAAFQAEALALVRQKALSREDCAALVSSFARIATSECVALRDAMSNPRPCVDCEGEDCERCGGTGFYCVSCPTYTRAADLWQALIARTAERCREKAQGGEK